MIAFVAHEGYGCETGCVGHRVYLEDDGREVASSFVFDSPWKEDHREFAERLIRKEFGDAHVADLDWSRCYIVED